MQQRSRLGSRASANTATDVAEQASAVGIAPTAPRLPFEGGGGARRRGAGTRCGTAVGTGLRRTPACRNAGGGGAGTSVTPPGGAHHGGVCCACGRRCYSPARLPGGLAPVGGPVLVAGRTRGVWCVVASPLRYCPPPGGDRCPGVGTHMCNACGAMHGATHPAE